MIEARGQILTTDILARFVVGDEGHEFHVLTLIKERGLDPIYFDVGFVSHKLFAEFLQMSQSDIGFVGRVERFLDTDAKLTEGGGSLSSEFNPTYEEAEATFRMVQTMMRELGGELSWG